MGKLNLVEFLVNYYNSIRITKQEANLILEAIEDQFFYDSIEGIKEFVEECLYVFKEKEEAFDWFYDTQNEGLVEKELLCLDIKSDMIGKNFKDILLESNDNYVQINDDLFITWLMS